MAGDLAEPGPSAILTFSHRIQRAKAWAFGHVRCAQLSAPLSSTARRSCAPCRFCQSHEPQPTGLIRIIIQKGCPMTMAPIPAVALTPVAYFPENYFLENRSFAPTSVVSQHGAAKRTVVRAQREAGHCG
jgi:hypothetical protein